MRRFPLALISPFRVRRSMDGRRRGEHHPARRWVNDDLPAGAHPGGTIRTWGV